MPAIPIIAAVVGVAGSVYASNQASNAAQAGLTAQQTASQQQLAAQQQALAQTQANNAPYNQGGLAALDAILQQLGIGQYNSQPRQDWSGYIHTAGNEDIAAAVENGLRSGEIGPNGQWQTGEEWAQWHYEHGGGREDNRFVPMTAPPPRPTTGQPAAPTPATYTPLAPTNTPFDDSAFRDGGQYGPGMAPDALSFFDVNQYQQSPDYAILQKEAAKGVNSGYAAKNLLRSGFAQSALATKSAELASKDVDNWVKRQGLKWSAYKDAFDSKERQRQADRAFAYGSYADNQAQSNWLNSFNQGQANWTNTFNQNLNAFNQSQSNFNTGNLFNLLGIGQSAANGNSAAGQNYAANTGNIFQNQATATGNAANTQAANNIYTGGQLAGTLSNLLNSYNRPSQPAAPWASPYGGASSSVFNNTASSLSRIPPSYQPTPFFGS